MTTLKAILFTACAALGLALAPNVHAQNVEGPYGTEKPHDGAGIIAIEEEDDVVITGTVTQHDFGELILEADGEDFTIDLSDVDLDAEPEDMFPVGARLAIKGSMEGVAFDDRIVQAEDIIFLTDDLDARDAYEIFLDEDEDEVIVTE